MMLIYAYTALEHLEISLHIAVNKIPHKQSKEMPKSLFTLLNNVTDDNIVEAGKSGVIDVILSGQIYTSGI